MKLRSKLYSENVNKRGDVPKSLIVIDLLNIIFKKKEENI
jgi:hypothetical protein